MNKRVGRGYCPAVAVLPTAEMCVAGRELGEPRPSPDGGVVAFTVAWGSRAALAMVAVAGGPERLVTSSPDPRPGRGGGCFDWLPDGSGLVYAARDGNLWLQPFPGGSPRRLTDQPPDRPAMAPAVSPDGSHVAFVEELARIVVVPTAGGPGIVHWLGADFVTDPAWSPDGLLAWHEWSAPAMAWDESRIVVVGGAGEPEVVGRAGHQAQQPRFGADGVLWSLRDDTGWLNVWRAESPVIDERHEHGGPTWGPGQRSFALAPDGGACAVARNEGGFGRLVVAEVGTGTVRELGRGVHQQIGWRGGVITAMRSGARTPPQIVAYDAAEGTRRVLAEASVIGWEAVDLVEPDRVVWASDDDTEIHGRLYRCAAPTGRMLCWIHGGPTDQWPVSFMPRIAYWVARGWNVFVPDFRGSTGHGRAHQQAMTERWGELDVADVLTGIRAAHLQGWGRPDRTVVIGGSSGGFTALHVAASEPAVVAGVVAAYPVTDLILMDDTTHRFEAHYNATLVGRRPAHDARYRARSPITFADRISVPVLVFHGDVDPVVDVEQSRHLVEAIRQAGGSAELVVYEGEGHGFRSPVNQLDEYSRIGEFLGRIVA